MWRSFIIPVIVATCIITIWFAKLIVRPTQLVVVVLHLLVVLRRNVLAALLVGARRPSGARPKKRRRRGGRVEIEEIHAIQRHVRWAHGAREGRCWQGSVTIGVEWWIGSRESCWRRRRRGGVEESRWSQERINHRWRTGGRRVEATAGRVVRRRGRGRGYWWDWRTIIKWLWGRWSGGRRELSPQCACVSHGWRQIGPREAATGQQHVANERLDRRLAHQTNEEQLLDYLLVRLKVNWRR